MVFLSAIDVRAASRTLQIQRDPKGVPMKSTRIRILTSAQQDQAKAIWEKEKPTLEPLMKQMHQNHADMRALQASGPFDEAKTRALATQHAQTMIEVEVQHARIKSELMQVLTADQKAKLANFEAKHEAHMQMHMKEHMQPGPEN